MAMTPEQESAAIARIARESEERFGKRASKEKIAFRDAERAKLKLGKEKRQRGGAARVWDANKQFIKPIVAGAAGMLPGVGQFIAPLLGAAMGGFDRPGKGGIGFDVGRGLRGAAEGHLAGAAGAGLKGVTQGAMGASGSGFGGMARGAMQGGKESLGNYFGPAAASPQTPAGPSVPMTEEQLATQIPSASAATAAPTTTGGTTTGGGFGLRNLGGSALKFAQANPNVVAGVVQGVGGAIGAGAQRDATLAEMEFEREQFEQRQLARRRMAELLSPEWADASRRRTMPLATANLDFTPTDFASLNPNRPRA